MDISFEKRVLVGPFPAENEAFAVEADGHAAGSVTISYGYVPRVEKLYIAEEYRRQGIGLKVVSFIRDVCASRGKICFTYECGAGDTEAAAFSEAAGGTRVETNADGGTALYLFFTDECYAEKAADAANTIAAFLGVRDKPGHTDIAVLFGGSILAGGDMFADIIAKDTADRYIIVGGEGHTTEALRTKMRKELKVLPEGRSEAEYFARYLAEKYGLEADALETRSTNCGNNITNLIALVEEKGYPFSSVTLTQDASMQLRMAATLKKYRPDIRIVNMAAYGVKVLACGGKLRYDRDVHGMWEIMRYFRLLTGEIPRLTDDENGYGPRGKNFIAHVDVPESVREAFEFLKQLDADSERKA